MMHKEPVRRSFLLGKPFRPALPSPPAYITSSLPTGPWPPSLVPTWQTTAWTGVCFSRLSSSGSVITLRGNSLYRAVLFILVSRCRETLPLGARARAPPLGIRDTLKKDGGSAASIQREASGHLERAKQ
jgi:hypothetical protein